MQPIGIHFRVFIPFREKKEHFIAASGIVAEFSRNTLLSRFVYMEINFSPGYMSANNKFLSDCCEALLILETELLLLVALIFAFC